MKEVFLRNVWNENGVRLQPTNSMGEEALRSFPNNATLRVKITQERLLSHHNFFFAFLAEVFQAWPATHRRIKPNDEDHLRAWLLVEAGIKDSAFVAWEGGINDQLINALRGVGRLVGNKPMFFNIDFDGGLVEVQVAKSLKFNKMDEQDFKETTARVFDVIYKEAGIDVDEYYREYIKKNGKLKIEPYRNVRGAG